MTDLGLNLGLEIKEKARNSSGIMVARDGVEWNYVPLDGLTLYPNASDTEYPASI